MKEKAKRLKVPKRFSIKPILIHVNGVEENVLESNYFDKVIDFGQLLSKDPKKMTSSTSYKILCGTIEDNH